MADAEGLFTANHSRLFRYFCRAVGRAETARDLTQEVFLRVSRTPIREDADGDLRGWLFRIARNLALDHYRTRQRHPEPLEIVVEPTRSASQDIDLAVKDASPRCPRSIATSSSCAKSPALVTKKSRPHAS